MPLTKFDTSLSNPAVVVAQALPFIWVRYAFARHYVRLASKFVVGLGSAGFSQLSTI